jgi:hypothetical protein
MHPANRVKRNCPLALIRPDAENGFNVLDTRSGFVFAWRHDLHDAAAVVAWLNNRYPFRQSDRADVSRKRPGLPMTRWSMRSRRSGWEGRLK